MAMNRELIGRSYPPSIYEVREDAMIRYARATNETNPRFLDPDVEGGMTVVFNNENFLKLQYEGHFAEDTTLHAGTGKFGVKF